MFIGPNGTWENFTTIDGRSLWRFSIVGGKEKVNLSDIDMDIFLRKALGGDQPDYEIIKTVQWRRSQYTAATYHKGRIMLAGDAAHTMSPTGGHRLTSGIGDTVGLSWILQALTEGWGGPILLDAYTAERRPVALRNGAGSTRNFGIWIDKNGRDKVLDDGPEADEQRDCLGKNMAANMRQEFQSLGLALGYSYPKSPLIIPDGSPAPLNNPYVCVQTARPGHRAPHYWLGTGWSTIDLFGRDFILLCFGEESKDDGRIVRVAKELSIPLEIVMLILIFLCLRETIERRTPKPQSEKNNMNKGLKLFKRLFGPFRVIGLLRYPPVIVVVWSGVIAFFAMFILNVSIQSTFEKAPYNFSVLLVGLIYLAPTIGYAISSVLGGRWIDYIMIREARRANRYENGKLKFLPEDRMRENIWLALTLYPAALIWYGWSVDKGINWSVGCVACIFFGLGMMLVMGSVNTALTEFTPKRTSSGVALANFLRNILSCTGAIITQPLIDSIGVGWTCSMAAILAFVTGLAAILSLRTWGPQWRVVMDQKLNALKT